MNKVINNKLLNIVLVAILIYIVFLLREVWLPIYYKLVIALKPFVIAFAIAFVLYPLLKWLVKKKVPKWLAVLLIVLVVVSISGLTLYYLAPLLVTQLVELINSLSVFLGEISTKYDLNFLNIDNKLDIYSSKIMDSFGTYIMNGSFIELINTSIGYITNTIIVFVVSIYMLYDMDKIRAAIKDYFKDKKSFKLIQTYDKEMYLYLKGLLTFMVVQFFEYTIAFMLIGHPNFLLIAFLASVTTIIPYIGGFITNIIAIIIASVVSTNLLILTIIMSLVLPNIDGYIISPRIYKKTNRISPLLTIFAVFTFGVFWGFMGIVVALPLTIILTSTYKIYKQDIENKIKKIKEKRKHR
ncbi:MAG TPA: AI-2E family transporter [Bacilli bacterium]|nr:AI-2E family transporter [Bacilli bacterium]